MPAAQGFKFIDDFDVAVEQAIANKTGAEGFLLENDAQLILDGCIAQDTALQGYDIIASCSNVALNLCKANKTGAEGFLIEQPSQLILDGCEAQNTALEGFKFSGGFDIAADNCIANKTGAAGFLLDNAAQLILDGCVAQDTVLQGYDITASCSNVALNLCKANKTGAEGFLMEQPSQLILDGCEVQNTALEGFKFSGGFDIAADNCIANKTGAAGFLLENAAQLILDGCVAQNTVLQGYDITASCSNVELKLCKANKTGAEGFLMEQPSQLILDGCEVQNTALEGFKFSQGFGIAVNDCIANNAGLSGFSLQGPPGGSSGFVVENSAATNCGVEGFYVDLINDLALKNCVATDNANNGFNLVTTDHTLLCECLAHGNGVNGVNIDSSSNDTQIMGGCIAAINNLGTNTMIVDLNIINQNILALGLGCENSINSTNVPYTITQPGHYCLTQSINGIIAPGFPLITILSNNVVLDLNGHVISNPDSNTPGGYAVQTSGINVVIQNGLINGANILVASAARDTVMDNLVLGTSGLLPANITIGGRNTQVSNTTIAGGGLIIDDGINTSIDNVKISDAMGDAITLNGQGTMIRYSEIKTATSNGIYISDTADTITIDQCKIEASHLNGIFIDSASFINITNCESISNVVAGFRIDPIMETLVDGCYASYNGGPGFLIGPTNYIGATSPGLGPITITGSRGIRLINNASLDNNGGFQMITYVNGNTGGGGPFTLKISPPVGLLTDSVGNIAGPVQNLVPFEPTATQVPVSICVNSNLDMDITSG